MTDLHSHILPNIDDGSESCEQSLEMLKMLSSQGVTRVVATPHFYADKTTVTEFLQNRNNAFSRLSKELTPDLPQIVLGAEVSYYEGISHLENLKSLQIENSDFLLLEMPFKKWSKFTVSELLGLSANGSLTVVIAHIDRYLKFIDRQLIDLLIQNGILFQVNAEAFSSYFLRKKVLKLLNYGAIHFIGTDSHNITDRKPNYDIAKNALIKKFGSKFFESFVDLGNRIFPDYKLK